MNSRSNQEYKEGELEVILSLPPTADNIHWLSKLLDRSTAAIEIVYKIAFEHGPFGRTSTAQQRKILEAKQRVGIGVERGKVSIAYHKNMQISNVANRGYHNGNQKTRRRANCGSRLRQNKRNSHRAEKGSQKFYSIQNEADWALLNY
jgi:hypothetical protein